MAMTVNRYDAVVLHSMINTRSMNPGDLLMEIYDVEFEASQTPTLTCKNINNVKAVLFSFQDQQDNDIYATCGPTWSASGATITFDATSTTAFTAETGTVIVIGTWESTTAPAL